MGTRGQGRGTTEPSPARRHDRGKTRTCGRFGVPEVWLVDIPPGVVEVHVLSGERYVIEQSATGDDEIRSHVLPEHTFRAAELFPTLPPE